MFTNETIREAGHYLYASSYASEADGAGLSLFGPGEEITAAVPRLDDETQHDREVWRLLGKVEQCWGVSPWLVMHHLGIEQDSEEQALAVYRLCMSVYGHGIDLSDDYDLDPVAEKLGADLDNSPHDEDTYYRELATDNLPTAAR